MKLAIVTVLVLGLTLGSAFEVKSFPSTFGIKEDIEDFIALIPREKVLNIVISYLATDKEVQETLQYVLSDDFKDIIRSLESIQEYKQFLKYLQSNGFNVYYYIQKLHDALGMEQFVPKSSNYVGTKKEGGVRGMLNEIEAILPVKQLQQMFDDKMATSPAFANLIAQMRSDDFQEIVDEMRANPDFKALIESAKSHGIDVQAIHDILQKIFGW